MRKKMIAVYFDPRDLKTLKAIADKKRLKSAQLIRMAVVEWIERNEQPKGKRKGPAEKER